MPQMANITVKNAAGTDVVYVAASPSAGDKTPAVWTQNALSGMAGLRPKFTVTSRNGGENGNVRRVDFTLEYPVSYTDSTTSRDIWLASVKFTGSVALPSSVSTDDWDEAFTQAGNLLVSSLVRDAVSDGYAPT